MQGFLASFVRSEVADLERKLSGLLLLVVSMVLLLLAVLFAMFSSYLWLATVFQPWQAALAVAGILLVVCAFIWIMARLRLVRRMERRSILESEMGSYANLFSYAPQSQKLFFIAITALIGLIVRRRMIN